MKRYKRFEENIPYINKEYFNKLNNSDKETVLLLMDTVDKMTDKEKYSTIENAGSNPYLYLAVMLNSEFRDKIVKFLLNNFDIIDRKSTQIGLIGVFQKETLKVELKATELIIGLKKQTTKHIDARKAISKSGELKPFIYSVDRLVAGKKTKTYNIFLNKKEILEFMRMID